MLVLKELISRDFRVTVFGRVRKIVKAIISFFMSGRPSVAPHGTTWLPLDRFLWHLVFECFSKNCRENSSFIKIGHEYGYFACTPIYIFDHILPISF